MSESFKSGALIVWWEGNRLSLSQLLSIEGDRARLFTRRGKERRVPLARLAWQIADPVLPSGVPGPETMELLRSAIEGLDALAEEVDVTLLWELAHESQEEGQSAAALAELVWGVADGRHRAALVLALIADGVRFERKDSLWLARDEGKIDALLHQQSIARRRLAEEKEFEAALRTLVAGDPFVPSGSDTERRGIAALEALAIFEDALESQQRDLAMTWLRASGLTYDRPHEGAFRLLRKLGRFVADDENLWIRRYRLRDRFSDEVLEAAARAAASIEESPRRELTDLFAVSVDDPETTEIDDLLSIEPRDDGGLRLHVHIADPAAFVACDDPVDEDARECGVTHYLPDRRLTMFPPVLGESAASLIPGERRPALTFALEIDAQGELESGEIARSWVRSDRKLSYDEADRAIAEEPAGRSLEGVPVDWIESLERLGRLRTAARDRDGAVRLLSDDLEVKTDAEGRPKIRVLSAESPARIAVGEAMIAAGITAARYCHEHEIPVFFRRQSAPERWEPIPPGGVRGAVAIRAVRRRLKRAEATLQPGLHFALGAELYVQTTSPLRRYQDLVVQRQIIAHLEGREPPYDREALQRVQATTDPAEAGARRAEREANDYWLLRWYEGKVGTTIEAQVVNLHPRPVVRLLETGREQRLSSLSGVELGQLIALRIERVNPRAGLLVLQRV